MESSPYSTWTRQFNGHDVDCWYLGRPPSAVAARAHRVTSSSRRSRKQNRAQRPCTVIASRKTQNHIRKGHGDDVAATSSDRSDPWLDPRKDPLGQYKEASSLQLIGTTHHSAWHQEVRRNSTGTSHRIAERSAGPGIIPHQPIQLSCGQSHRAEVPSTRIKRH